MKFSRKTDYGIILMEALRPTFLTREFFSLAHIAKKNHMPLVFLGKLAEILRGAGFLESRRGSGGGYRLIQNPNSITLKVLIDSLEEPAMMRCMRSADPKKQCALAGVCPTRKKWGAIEEKVDAVFNNVTLASL